MSKRTYSIVKRLLNHIRHSFTAQITLWVVGFAAVLMGITLVIIANVLYLVEGYEKWKMMTTAIVVVAISMVVLLLLCWWVIGHHLHPMNLLATSAQRIASGRLEETVPDTGQRDEIGQLQNSFASMQRALAGYIAELQQKRDTLNRQNQELMAAYEQAREADNVKTLFLGRMTEQMEQTVAAIGELTETLCRHHAQMDKNDMMKIRIQMLSHTHTVTHLLDHMLNGNGNVNVNVNDNVNVNGNGNGGLQLNVNDGCL